MRQILKRFCLKHFHCTPCSIRIPKYFSHFSFSLGIQPTLQMYGTLNFCQLTQESESLSRISKELRIFITTTQYFHRLVLMGFKKLIIFRESIIILCKYLARIPLIIHIDFPICIFHYTLVVSINHIGTDKEATVEDIQIFNLYVPKNLVDLNVSYLKMVMRQLLKAFQFSLL